MSSWVRTRVLRTIQNTIAKNLLWNDQCPSAIYNLQKVPYVWLESNPYPATHAGRRAALAFVRALPLGRRSLLSAFACDQPSPFLLVFWASPALSMVSIPFECEFRKLTSKCLFTNFKMYLADFKFRSVSLNRNHASFFETFLPPPRLPFLGITESARHHNSLSNHNIILFHGLGEWETMKSEEVESWHCILMRMLCAPSSHARLTHWMILLVCCLYRTVATKKS